MWKQRPLQQDLTQYSCYMGGRLFTMKSLCRCIVWLVLAVRHACGAPLDQEKIYFPGENPDGDVESRSNGIPLQQYQTEEEGLGRNVGWSGYNMHNRQTSQQHHIKQMSPYGGYGLGNGLTGGYQRGEWGQDSLGASAAATSDSNGVGRETHHPYLPGIPDTANYQQEFPHFQGQIHSLGNDAFNGEQKIKKHMWSPQNTGETAGLQYEPHQVAQTGGNSGLDAVHEQTFSFNSHHNNPDDLTSIIDGQSDHKLHPNIKEALDHVIKDYRETSGQALAQPSHHTVHKISHIKKTTVQNVGREPSHIQSTSSDDDINLSQLIEQLQLLEQSPRHINITWCEEKIKEFLRELRRKQASGVYINQQVQEQTLHHVLTQETSESNESAGVYEPPMTRVTVKPLGREDQSQSVSNLITNQQSHVNEVSVDQAQEESSNHQQQVNEPHVTDVLTVVPPTFPQEPEKMSHQYEQVKDVPPFISDNSSDLKELELELPEYVPFEHSHSGVTGAFEGSSHKESRPISHSSAVVQSHSEISTSNGGHDSLPQKSIETELSHTAQQDMISEQQMTESHHTSKQISSEDIPGSSQTSHEETSANWGTHTGTNMTEELKSPLTHELPQIHSGEESEKYIESVQERNHTVHGRPQAPQEELNGSHEEKSQNTKETEHVLNPAQVPSNEYGYETSLHTTETGHHVNSNEYTSTHIENHYHQQVNYDNLIEELIQLESIPGHQAIDKCEEKIQEFLEILKYQQEQGFGRNQQELERLHQTLIEQAQERSKQLLKAEETSSSPTSFWRKVQKKLQNTYQSAKDKAKEAMG